MGVTPNPSVIVTPDEKIRRRLRMMQLLIFLLCGFVYTNNVFQRVAPNVMGPILIKDIGLEPQNFGTLGMVYIWAFSLIQAPIGTILDRLGARRGVTLALFLGMTGCVIFSMSHSFSGLVFSRILIGMAPPAWFTVGAVVLSQWFTKKQYPQVWGFFSAFGYVGAIFATKPLQVMISEVGWRNSYLVLAGYCATLGILFYLLARDKPAQYNLPDPMELAGETRVAKNAPPRGSWIQDWKEIILTKHFVCLVLYYVGIASTSQVMVSLWGGVFLADVYKFPQPTIASLFFYWSACMVVGAAISGTVSRFLRTSGAILLGASIFLCLWLYLTVNFDSMSEGGFKVIFASMGVCHTLCIAGGFAYIKDWAEPRRIATTIGLVNGVQWMFGAGTFMQIWGWIIASYSKTRPYPPEAFQVSMWVQLVVLVMAVLCCVYFFIHQRRQAQ